MRLPEVRGVLDRMRRSRYAEVMLLTESDETYDTVVEELEALTVVIELISTLQQKLRM
jgi:hypothetical protein